MNLTLPFTLKEESQATAVYAEQTEGGKSPVIGTISINKSALPVPLPSIIGITVSRYRERPSEPEPDGAASSLRTFVGEYQPKVGDAVTIVKSRRATLASPPEWLEQFLGRTGIVLWTSHLGAMVELSDSATWFAYEELERESPRP